MAAHKKFTQFRRWAESQAVCVAGPATWDALFRYGELLLRWNQAINLTGARSIEALMNEHWPDAVALARVVPPGARFVDVGSGGGLPAIPVALLCPSVAVTMVEPRQKRVAFLRNACRELGLRTSVIRAERAEELASAIASGGVKPFDFASSKATWSPEEWLALGMRLIGPAGHVAVLGGGSSPAPAGAVQCVRYSFDPGRELALSVYSRTLPAS